MRFVYETSEDRPEGRRIDKPHKLDRRWRQRAKADWRRICCEGN
jgi:hypothetical protein